MCMDMCIERRRVRRRWHVRRHAHRRVGTRTGGCVGGCWLRYRAAMASLSTARWAHAQTGASIRMSGRILMTLSNRKGLNAWLSKVSSPKFRTSMLFGDVTRSSLELSLNECAAGLDQEQSMDEGGRVEMAL